MCNCGIMAFSLRVGSLNILAWGRILMLDCRLREFFQGQFCLPSTLFSQSELFYGLWRREPAWPSRDLAHKSACLSLLPLPSLSKSTERQIVTAGCKGGKDPPPPLLSIPKWCRHHLQLKLNWLGARPVVQHSMRTVASLFLTSTVWLLLYTLSPVFTHFHCTLSY